MQEFFAVDLNGVSLSLLLVGEPLEKMFLAHFLDGAVEASVVPQLLQYTASLQERLLSIDLDLDKID
jgi:hypothetical protein